MNCLFRLVRALFQALLGAITIGHKSCHKRADRGYQGGARRQNPSLASKEYPDMGAELPFTNGWKPEVKAEARNDPPGCWDMDGLPRGGFL